MDRFNPLAKLPTEARLRQLQIISSRLVESLLAGNYRSVFRGPGLEFDEVREYVDGDDTRRIDWNVSSRMGSIYTKTYREERELNLFMVVDLSRSLDFGSEERSAREVALIATALLTLAATHNNDKVGSVLFTDRIESWIPPAKGRRHAMRLLQELVSVTPQGVGSDIALALRTVNESLKRRGIVFVISDFHSTGYQRELALLSRKHDVVAVRITDPLYKDLPDFGFVQFADLETGATLRAVSDSRRFRFLFEQFWARQRQQWLRECRRRGVSAIEIATVDHVADRLIAFFKRHRKR